MRKPIARTCVLVTAGLLSLHVAQAQTLDYVDASFSVEYNDKRTQAENHLKIQRDHDQYQIHFDLDHWLLSSKQKATFDMKQCHVQPMSYAATNKQPFKDEKHQTIAFDWVDKKAIFNSENEEKTFDLDPPLYDPLSFFFEARCELIAGKKDFIYPLIYKGNKRTHHYKVIGNDMVQTGQGQVEALVVERVRSSTTRKTRLYVAPSLDYLLVKFEHQENRVVKISATLQHMDYRLSNR
ncbi:DUF3108 domain-containing protein [Alcaligenaceae bacterium]|nr:DUF3108 domain-containing protein [Alcaligenaceae bacterium]